MVSARNFQRINDALKFAAVQSFGEHFFVDSNHDDASSSGGRTPDHPCDSLDTAIDLCTANNGDVIHIAPGHTETIIADSGIDIDKAGITIIGYGVGSNRPTFTFTTAATADFKLAAANTIVQNCLFVAGIDALTGPIEISAANCQLLNCEYQDDDTNNYETIDVVTLLTAAHNCVIDGFRFIHPGGSGGTQIQSVINAVSADGLIVRNSHIVCDGANGCIEDATASVNLLLHNNWLQSTHTNDVVITLAATSSGFVTNNKMRIATDAQLTWISATNLCTLIENYGVNDDGEAGILEGTPSA